MAVVRILVTRKQSLINYPGTSPRELPTFVAARDLPLARVRYTLHPHSINGPKTPYKNRAGRESLLPSCATGAI